eukprot:TRINITY_DN3736_c0_g1_i1.p1 TRINITY_DN3736_c0_g1~~TRINITY_DN3736_c0_g1_i1.p1  ORF type:complete len:713 (+),score=175.33 TRINITY_DN3736_c0_g1_i1:152-2290(+)
MDDGRSYFDRKYEKLNVQFGEDYFGSQETGKLFDGMVVCVSKSLCYFLDQSYQDRFSMDRLDNGDVIRLVMNQAAKVVHFIDSTVTHFVSTELPVHLKKKLSTLKFVTVSPLWVLDCIVQEKKLPVHGYRTDLDKNTSVEDFVEDRRDESELEEDIEIEEERRDELEVDTGIRDEKSSKRMLTSEENPNFILDYFSKSRLHHLSEWKTLFTEKMIEFVSNLEGNNSIEPNAKERLIVYVDMDCFFASASLLKYPEHKNDPVVVSHGGNNSDVASCNYIARDYGVKNGTRLFHAREQCPQLIVLDYDYVLYEEISTKLFNILSRFSSRIEVKSCDEAVMEIPIESEIDIRSKIEKLRNEVFSETGCTCSVGVGINVLTAKLSLIHAKPNGMHISPLNALEIKDWMKSFKIRDLPGIGRSIVSKLSNVNIHDIDVLQETSTEYLKDILGNKIGETVSNYSKGIDFTELNFKRERKSIGIDLTYAIRFTLEENIYKFIYDICEELVKRLKHAKAKGRKITLHVKRKRDGLPPQYYNHLGHGPVDNFSKSKGLKRHVDDVETIASVSISLYKSLNIPTLELRGIGIHVSQLGNEKRKRISSEAKKEKTLKKRRIEKIHFKRKRMNCFDDTILSSRHKSVLLAWMEKIAVPEDVHKELLFQYLKEQTKKNLENVTYILKLMKLNADDDWKEAAKDITLKLQTIITETYGAEIDSIKL